MATIHDVAKRAGVSAATVSHVINNSRFVSAETRQKVVSAIEALRYRRDGVARSLRRSETGTIGLIISDITNPYFSDLVRGVEDAVYGRRGGDNLILCNTDEDDAKERLYLDVLMEKRVDGLIVAPAGGNRDYFSELVASSFPLVFVDRFLPEVEADSVVVDNRRAAFDLVSHLVRLGHRRIAVMKATLAATSIDERIDGYRAALVTARIPFDGELLFQSSSDIEEARQVGLEILRARSLPTAVFCTNNFMTLGLMGALTELNLRCPDDIAIVGFDDFPWATSFHPKLTVVAQPSYAIGERAVSLLFDRMSKDAGAEIRQEILDTTILIRESCGAASRNAGPPSKQGHLRASRRFASPP